MHWHYTPSSSLFSSAGGWWLRHSQKDGGGRVKRQNRPFTEHPLFTSPFLRIGSRCSSLERSLFLCHSFNGSISLNDASVPRLYSLSRVTPAILKCYRAWDSSVHVLGYFRTVREVDYRAIQCGGEGREVCVCVCVCVCMCTFFISFLRGDFFVFILVLSFLKMILVYREYVYVSDIYIYDLTLDFSATRFKHEVPIRTYTWDLTIKTSIWCSSCHGKIKKVIKFILIKLIVFLFPPFKINANLIRLFYRECVCVCNECRVNIVRGFICSLIYSRLG